MPGLIARRRQRRMMRASARRPVVRRATRASASKLKLDDKKALKAQWARRQEWQDEAWAYFDDVPEIKYSVWYEGNVMAKARFFVGVRDPKNPDADPIPIDDANSQVSPDLARDAQAELARLTGPLGGMPEITRELNMNLEVAGEAYLVGFAEVKTTVDGEEVITPEEWDIKSVSEVEKIGDDIVIKSGSDDNNPRKLNTSTDTIIRVWQRHPRWSMQPDCNMRGVLGECEALTLLSNQVKAEAKSRMNAGYFTLPNELGQGPESVDTESEDGDEAQNDPLMEELYAGATDPIEDPSSAAAVSPTFIRGPGEFLQPQYLRHISISRDASGELEARIQARVERVARGLNLPVEVVMGHQQTTFANAEQVDEDIYTKHFQPRCILIADALTVAFLIPQLLDPGPVEGATARYKPEDVANLVVWFDPADMLKQADPVQFATEALNLDVISEETYRRLRGFTEDDAPDPEERLIRTVLHLRTFDPGISTAILELMGVPLDIPDTLPSSGTASASAVPTAMPPVPEQVRAMLDAALEARHKGIPVDVESLLRAVFPMIAASRRPSRPALSKAAAEANVGYELMMIDRELRARLRSAASSSLDRVLERAGNRLRTKLKASAQLRPHNEAHADVDAQRLCAAVGRRVVAAAGFVEDDLVSGDAWDALEQQFMQWGGHAQKQALATVKKIVGLSDHSASELASRQFANLGEAWDWMRDALHDLAVAKIYQPDVIAGLGEFDPTSRVPTGLIREALSRAGGATGLTVQNGNPYVVLSDDRPVGGIATGELVTTTLTHEGALVEGYEWVYGPAFRLHEFEDHSLLNGEVFDSFTSDVLASDQDWIGDFYYPGDHDGCVCDVVPVILAPEDLDGGD